MYIFHETEKMGTSFLILKKISNFQQHLRENNCGTLKKVNYLIKYLRLKFWKLLNLNGFYFNRKYENEKCDSIIP